MTNENFQTFIDFGKTAIRGSSFNKETKKVENHIELKIQNDLINNFSNEEKLIEDLIFNLEKKNGEYLNEIFLMVDNSNILSTSITILKRSDEQILDKNFKRYITDEAKFEINKNYPNYEIVHSVIKNFFVDEKKFSKLPNNLNHKKFAVEFNFFVFPKFFLENLKKVFARHNVVIKKFIFSSYSKSLFYLDKISDKKKKFSLILVLKKLVHFFLKIKKWNNIKYYL